MSSDRYTTFGLPFFSDVAQSYHALDLPYGAPLEQVTRRWKSYLKKCHPDRHLDDPDMLATAHELTRVLTEAHDRIKAAWELYDKLRGLAQSRH